MKGSHCLAEFTVQENLIILNVAVAKQVKKVSTFYNSIQSAVDGKFQDKLEYFVLTTNSPRGRTGLFSSWW
jgi:hypothetical protein